MKNKKGFTLIELLAVISVLALLIIIALPNIIELFKGAKRDSFESELKQIFKTAQTQWVTEANFKEKVYSKTSNGNCPNSLKLSGRSNIDYYIKINKKGKIVEFSATDGTYRYFYKGKGLDIEDTEYLVGKVNEKENSSITINCSSVIEAENIADVINTSTCNKTTPGCEVTFGGENFYVVSSDSNETVLLAKYAINTKTNSQDASNPTMSLFSTITYWTTCREYHVPGTLMDTQCEDEAVYSTGNLVSPYSDGGKVSCINQNDTNCAYVYDENSSLYKAIKKYTTKISSLSGSFMTGRVLSLEEANTLSSSVLKINKNYWTGTYGGLDYIWFINPSGSIERYGVSILSECNIRPVLVVSTSAL